MAEYTARDLRVARGALLHLHTVALDCDDCDRVATALAAERRRTLRGMARWVRRLYEKCPCKAPADGNYGCCARCADLEATIAEASRRARGSK